MPAQLTFPANETRSSTTEVETTPQTLLTSTFSPTLDRGDMIRHLATISPALGIPSSAVIGYGSSNGSLNKAREDASLLSIGDMEASNHTYGERSPLRNAARDAAISKLSPEERVALEKERSRFDHYNSTNHMINIPSDMREPGPTMQKVEAAAQRIETEARAAELKSLSAEEVTKLRNERIDRELQGKDSNTGPLVKEFEKRVLNRINRLQNDFSPQLPDAHQEVTAQTSAYDALLQRLVNVMEPGLKRANEATGLITKSEQLNEALKSALIAKVSGDGVGHELSKFADDLEAFANKTHSSPILEVVSAIRQFEALGGDIHAPESKAIGAKLSGLLSTVDTEIKFALRDSNRAIVKLVLQMEIDFAEQEAWVAAIAKGPAVGQAVLGRPAMNGNYGGSEQRKAVQRRLEEMNLVD